MWIETLILSISKYLLKKDIFASEQEGDPINFDEKAFTIIQSKKRMDKNNQMKLQLKI